MSDGGLDWIDGGADCTTGAPTSQDRTRKPATAARMYDYYLGGIHNFPADQDAARTIAEQFPSVPAMARANRAFLGRAVRHLLAAGIHQFLDIGWGIPTVGNVHEIAQAAAPESRVVYVDIDPMAVAESQDILAGNDLATALQADLRNPADILAHPCVRRLLDLGQPVGLLLVSVLHFVPDDDLAYAAVPELLDALAPGSHLVIAHVASETYRPMFERARNTEDVYRQRTSTPGHARTRPEVERFFTGVEMLDPGLVRVHDWRPDPDEPSVRPEDRESTGIWAGVGRKK